MEKPLESISTRDLSSIVSQMPWFSAARVELCRRTCGEDASQYEETAPYVFSRSILRDIAQDPSRKVAEDNRGFISEDGKKKVRVAGGDYFSQDEYDKVVESNIEYKPSIVSEKRENEGDSSSETDFCTEALAEIFAEQGYFSEALKIYSQLSLRYPEKSAYFATLIENTKKLERN